MTYDWNYKEIKKKSMKKNVDMTEVWETSSW